MSCIECGEALPDSATAHRLYCSVACRGRHWRRNGAVIVEGLCRDCRKPLSEGRRRFCSRLCGRRFRAREAINEVPDGYRRCRLCRQVQQLGLYEESSRARDGRKTACRGCADGERIVVRGNDYRRKYGLTAEDYQALFLVQGGRCAVCPRGPDESDFGRLCVDHCHSTGRVRALLCSNCNKGLGLFGDNLEVMRSAVDYLARHEALTAERIDHNPLTYGD